MKTLLFVACVAVCSVVLSERPASALDTNKVKAAIGMVLTGGTDGGPPVAAGSAFCIASNATDSIFVTADHVLRGATRVRFVRHTPSLQAWDVDVKSVQLGTGEQDIAVFRVPRPYMSTLRLDLRTRSLLDRIFAAGYPVGSIAAISEGRTLGATLALGSIANIVGESASMYGIGVQPPIAPGNSGGPLLDPESGAVVGLVIGRFNHEEFQMDLALPITPVVAPYLSARHVPFVVYTPQRATAGSIDGVWSATTDARHPVAFGGPSTDATYCSYRDTVVARGFKIQISGGEITSATLRRWFSETALNNGIDPASPCPFPTLPVSDEPMNFLFGNVMNNVVDLAFAGTAGSHPLVNATFHGTLNGNVISGSMQFHRTDSVGTMNWSVPVSLELTRANAGGS